MATYYFIVAFVLVLGFYAFANLKLRKDFVMGVEAGTTKGVTADELRRASYSVKHRVVKDRKGNVINPDSIIRIVVEGNCMRPLRINSGDEMIAIKIDNKRPLDEQIKPNDVLLIHLADKGIKKIRAFEAFEGRNLKTFWFEEDGQKHPSSKVHTPESILGIVRYRG